jgi:hypothetical protein
LTDFDPLALKPAHKRLYLGPSMPVFGSQFERDLPHYAIMILQLQSIQLGCAQWYQFQSSLDVLSISMGFVVGQSVWTVTCVIGFSLDNCLIGAQLKPPTWPS